MTDPLMMAGGMLRRLTYGTKLELTYTFLRCMTSFSLTAAELTPWIMIGMDLRKQLCSLS